MQSSAFGIWKEPPSGALNRRITLQSATITQDSVGGEVATWSDVASVWAYINPLSGHELINAQSVYAEVTHLIVIRWQSIFADPQAVAKMRVSYSGRLFNIGAAIDVDMAHRWIALSAQEGLVDG